MTKKGKSKPQARLSNDPNVIDPDPKSQFKVEKAVENDRKVRPQQVFEGYKVPNNKNKQSNGSKDPKKTKVKKSGKK